MELNSMVVVSLADPKERFWGQLLAIRDSGITVRGIALSSFEEFLRQVKNPEEEAVGVATVFYPMRRVERIALDEPQGSIPSLAQTFERQVGQSVIDFLTAVAHS